MITKGGGTGHVTAGPADQGRTMGLQDRAAADEADDRDATDQEAKPDKGQNEGPDDGAQPDRTSVTPVTVLRGVGVGVVVAAGLALARGTGLIGGWRAGALLVLLVLALPTSRNPSRRLLLAGCLGLGWVPVLWWRTIDLGSLGRSGVLLAATGGLLAGWVTGGRAPLRQLRQLLPRPHLVDAFPLLAGGFTAWLLGSWLLVGSGQKALALLLPGWDNSAHANMAMMIRAHGATLDALGLAPDGTAWSYGSYPQGFHAVVATITELLTSPSVGSAAAEITWFARVTAIVMVVLVTTLIAGVCAVPQLRRRPALALPAVALIMAGFTLGPGAASLRSGHTNFIVGAGLVAATALVVWSMSRVVLPLHLAAVGGCLVGVAHNWALLLTMAVPAALVVVLPFQRRRWTATPTAWALSAAVAVATALGLLQAMRVLSSIKRGTLLSLTGSIVSPPVGVVLAVAVGAVAACLAAGWAGPRAVTVAVLPGAGLATMGGIAAQQLRTSPTLTYYFWKYATGVELAGLVLLALATAVAVTGRRVRVPDAASSARSRKARGARWTGAAASVVAAVAVTQVFGYAGPGATSLGSDPITPDTALRRQSVLAVKHPPRAAFRLLAATRAQAWHPRSRVFYLALPPWDVADTTNANQWYWSLTRTWTAGANCSRPQPIRRLLNLDAAAAAATKALTFDPNRIIIVGPEVLGPLRARLAPKLRALVITW